MILTYFTFDIIFLTHSLLCVDMARKKNKFAEAARTACKGKTVAGISGRPPKRACQEEVFILLPPFPPPTIEGATASLPKPSSTGTPVVDLVFAEPSQESVGAEVTLPQGIQHLALGLTRMTSLLEKPRLLVLITKNALMPGDCHRLNAVQTDDIYGNIIHSAMESALCAYMVKERDKGLR